MPEISDCVEEQSERVVRFAYLDESGDLAFKRLGIGDGTTDYFVVALLMVDDPIPVYAAVDDLKDRLGMPKREEFKYSKASPERRRALLQELRRYEITVRAVAVNKALVAGRPETSSAGLFYGDIVRRAIIRHRDDLDQTQLVLDEYVRGRQPQRKFNTMLRQAVNSEERRCLMEIKHLRSNSNNLIQAADMVAGAIYRARAHGEDDLLRIIQPRVREIWDWDGVEELDAPESL